jgi:hypothetical protein
MQSSLSSVLKSKSALPPSAYITGYTPTTWYRFSFRTIILTSLPILTLFGFYGTWTLSTRNGTFGSILELITEEKAPFPGTDELLVREYIGWKRVDDQLSVLVTIFAPVSDLRHGSLTLFAVWGFGQFGAVWTLMVMESLRMGNRGRFVGL